MKKKVFSLMMTLLLAFMGVAKADVVTIGDPTSTATNSYLPTYSLYEYSFSQQIYTADEIGTGGTINSLTMWLKNSSSYARNLNIYMKEVSESSFSSTSAWVSMTSSDLVATGTLNNGISDPVETTFTLSTPFNYTGEGNLVICFQDVTGSWNSGAASVVMDATNQSLYAYRDGTSYDPTAPGVSGTRPSAKSVIALDITPGGAGQSGELTLHDGTATNSYVPVYGFYADSYLKSESVYPASELSAMNGANITSMKFYSSSNSISWGAANFQVFLTEVASTTPSAFVGPGTVVYEGALSIDANGEMLVDFTTPYQYNGGNLLVGVYNTVKGSYVTCSWYGESVTGASYQGYSYTSLDAVTGSQRNFLPKMTFSYTTGGGESGEPIAYDFESGMQGWTSIDNDVDGNGWFHSSLSGTYSCYSYEGFGHNDSDGFLVSQSYTDCTYDSYDADNYLVSPQKYTMVGNSSINFFFDYANDDYPDYFEVCVATVDNPTASDFTAIWDVDLRSNAAKTQVRHNNDRYENWREVTVDLSAYAGQDVWIAFHHQDYDEYEVWIDDVTVIAAVPEVNYIDVVEINDFETPVWGQQVTQNVTIPEDANYSLMAASWFTLPHGVLPGREINPDPIYNLDDMDYIWGFILLPNEGYAFNPALEAYINGSSDLVLLARVITPEDAAQEPELPVGAAVIYTYAYYTYEEGLHTLSTYGVGESIDRLLIERPNGAWMEPYHFNLYNDGDEDVEVVLIDFLHNNGYFSMDEETTEYPFTVAANGRPGVDLYINTDFDWTDTEEINSLLAVNTTERSTHLYQIVAAPYTPYCPDVFEKAYDLGTVTEATEWSEYMSTLWDGPAQQFQLHQNYDMPDFAANIPDGYDAVMKFKVDRAMSLNASVVEGYQNGKVALYTEDFYGEEGPMATNNYTERPMQGGGSTPAGGTFEAQIGDEASTSTFSNVPYYNLYENSIGETLYTAAELQAAGVGRAPMTSLSWYATSVNGYTSGTIQIWMANVSETALTTTSHLTSGMTKVFSGNITPVMGWNEFQFNQGSFAWDGSSNVLICVLHNDTDWHGGLSWKAESSLGFNASAYDYDDYDVFNTTTNTYSLYTSTSRSIIKMKGGNNRDNVVFSDDFETVGSDNALPAGWTTIDADGDGNDWYALNIETIPGHSGNGIATSASYNGSVLYPDNYLVTPQVQLGGTLTFWACNQDAYPETIGVAVSTTSNTSASAFTTLSSWTVPMSRNGLPTSDTRSGNRVQGAYIQYTIDLSAYAGQAGYVAIRHFNSVDQFRVNIDDVVITAPSTTPDQPVDPDQPDSPFAAFSAGPVIENLNILPGTYYLVASSTDRDYEVEIGIEDLPCPEKAVVVAPVDNAEGIQPNSVTLKWLLDPNCTEYRLTFSTTYWPDDEVETHPQTILVDWTNDLAEEYTVTNLWNNTNYFWRVDQRTNGGECTTIGDIWGFTTHFNVPGNLTATPVELFEGQTTTLNWNSIVDRTYRYYYIYKDDEYLDRTTVNQVNMTTYTVPATELEYNMDGYKFNVTAIYDEGESDFSNDAIVKVSGYTNETGINGYAYEQDGHTPIGGVTVTITGTDEFNHEHTYTATTDENGYYHVQVYVGEYTVAVANKEGYQETTTTHALPFNAPHQGQVNDVNFIMDEVFYAPANVCAETVEVDGQELVKIWWDFNFYNEMVEDFETGDLSQFDWETTANYPWTITTNNPYEGTYCLKSGGAGVGNVVSDLNLTVEIPNDGILSFFIKPSCENNWDYGHFYLDGNEMATFTGAGNWGEKRYPVTEGEHTLRWSYTKDGSVNSNDDCVYLDYIRFNLLPEPPIAGDTYDFEDGMQGWTTIDADGDGYNWNMASNVMTGAAGHDGSADFVFSQSYDNNYGVLYPDNYFVSPQVQLGGQLRFYACAQDANYAAEHFGVAVSTTGNTSASAFTMVQEWTMSAKGDNNGKPVAMNTRSGRAQGTWYEYNVDLSAYAGQTGYIALRHFNCSDMFYLDVDDITIGDPNRTVAEEGRGMNRSLHHFNVYRTDCYNNGPYTDVNTIKLSTPWVPDTAYFDVSWPDAAPGIYKFGVSAVYEGNRDVEYPAEPRESEIVWSNQCDCGMGCIDKDMYILDGVTINVVLNSADSPEGTVVTFENTNLGEQLNHPIEPLTLDQTGYYVFPEFRKGNYNITIEKDGYFTQLDYQEIWEPMDLRYVLIEKIFNARELYVSRTGWAMWQPNGTLSNPEDDPMRHLEGYKVMCESFDHEPIYNVNTPADQPFCQVATDELVEGEHYICKVAAIYSTGMSDYIEAVWQYEPCDNYAGVVDGVVNVEGNTISWEYPGVGPTPPPAGDASTFSFGFEEGMPEGWTTIDGNNDGYTWCMTSDIPSTWTYYAGMDLDWYHNGTNAICSGSYINGVGAITPNDYLVSPLLTLAAGSQLSFWVAACDESYPADHFGVFVSDDAADWTSVQEWTLTAKKSGMAGDRASRDGNGLRVGTWYNYTVDLSAYAGQKYIAFRHFNCTDQYIMCLDDVALTAGAKSAPAGMFASANGRTGFQAAQNGMTNRDGWYYYDNGTNYDAIGLTAGGGFWWGIMFPAGTYEGNVLTKVSYFDATASAGQVLICQGGTDAPGTQLYAQSYTTTGVEDYIEINMDEPVALDATQNLWVVMHNTSGQYVASYDGASPGETNGSWLSTDNATWYESLYSATGGSYGGNWNLRAYLEEGTTPPVPPTPAEGILGAMIFVDGEWEAFVEAPTNTYTYEGDGQEICVRVVYDGTAELPENNYYYAMSCGDCVGGIEPQPECPFDATLTYEVNDTDDQVNLFWGEQPEPPTPAEGTTFVYDFENSSLDGLTLIDADGDGNNWMLASVAMSTGYGHNASVDMILSKSYDNNTGVLYPDNYIVFPIATIVEGSTFSFWGCGQDAGYVAEHFGVAVSTDGTSFTTIQEWTMTAKSAAKAARDGRDQGTWHQFSVDLSEYAGEEIYIALRHFNCSDMFYLDIDDVELSIAAKGNRDGIIGYNIYRSTDGISFDLIDTVAGDVYEYTDAPGAGSYYYYVTAVYEGCESAPTNTVQVGVTGVGDLSDNVNLFPNPTKGNVTIQAKDMNRITVVSVLGQVVFDTELDQDEYILNMAQFNTGMYMVRIYTDGGVTVKRVTVMH